MKEKWKKVKNYPYKVSNCGRVKRNKIGGNNTHIGKILKPGIDGWGYLQVNLCKNGKYRTIKIHKLVAQAFLGPCPKDKEVNHKDGNKQNPHIDNLEYITGSDNMKHAYRLGLQKSKKGQDNPSAKLKKKDVLEIRKLYETEKYFQRELAMRFNVTILSISRIINNKTWSHI